MTQHKHAPDLDQIADDLAQALHSLPQAQAQTGGAAPPALPDREALAAQIRPHLTPEVVQSGLFGGGGGKPFNPTKFIENINAILPLVTTLVGLFGGPKIPPITIPAPNPPAGS